MDFVTALRFVHLHNDKVLAVLIVLFLVTAITLLLRSIGKGDSSAQVHAGAGGTAVIDAETLEAAMRKVLGSNSGASRETHGGDVAAPVAVAAGPLSPEVSAAVLEREQQIEVLQIALKEARDQAQLALANAPTPGSDGGAAPSVLQEKLEELQAKLSEYEIITDDIADLSLYKDDNARMKLEIEEMAKQLAAAQAASNQVAPTSRIANDQEAELKFEKAEKFELDINDDVMKAFAEAVDSGRIDKADGAYSLPPEEVDPEVRQGLEASAGKSADAAPKAVDDPQAAIDAMFASASEAVAQPAAATDPADPQAMIDAMLKEAEASGGEPPVPAKAFEKVIPDVNVDPLGHMLSTDAEKMISEMERLSAAVVPAGAPTDPLHDKVDTDKLLSEAATLSNDQSLDETAQDDLFAEFKDEKGQES